MEEFRKKVERRLNFYTTLCLCSLAVYCALNFFTKGASDFAQGLTLGIFCGMEVVAVYNLVRMLTAVRNEDKLKEMYINETDERNIAIQKETSQKASIVLMLGIAMAAIVAGFFDEKVCITLAAAIIFNALVNVIVNAYYNKKCEATAIITAFFEPPHMINRPQSKQAYDIDPYACFLYSCKQYLLSRTCAYIK